MTTDRTDLSRREREILDIVYALGRATSAEIRERLTSPPSGNAVRALIQILENKGDLVRLGKEGREYVYGPRESAAEAGKRALQHILETFYGGSMATALAVHLSGDQEAITSEEYERLQSLIQQARNPQEKNQ